MSENIIIALLQEIRREAGKSDPSWATIQGDAAIVWELSKQLQASLAAAEKRVQELEEGLEYIADEYEWCPCGAAEYAGGVVNL